MSAAATRVADDARREAHAHDGPRDAPPGSPKRSRRRPPRWTSRSTGRCGGKATSWSSGWLNTGARPAQKSPRAGGRRPGSFVADFGVYLPDKRLVIEIKSHLARQDRVQQALGQLLVYANVLKARPVLVTGERPPPMSNEVLRDAGSGSGLVRRRRDRRPDEL